MYSSVGTMKSVGNDGCEPPQPTLPTAAVTVQSLAAVSISPKHPTTCFTPRLHHGHRTTLIVGGVSSETADRPPPRMGPPQARSLGPLQRITPPRGATAAPKKTGGNFAPRFPDPIVGTHTRCAGTRGTAKPPPPGAVFRFATGTGAGGWGRGVCLAAVAARGEKGAGERCSFHAPRRDERI